MDRLHYSIITTARNEEKYISKTLRSVINQTILPDEWIIVNDGSTDKTAELITSYANKHTWITQIDLLDYKAEIKTTGGRVGHILNYAANALKLNFDIIVKLDADTEFDSSFFEALLLKFEENRKLGIASGNLIFEGKKEIIMENNSEVRGAVMLIRKEVFEENNGFFESRGRGEDTLFGVAARYFGWETKTFHVFFNHLKPEGIRHSIVHESYNTGFYKGSIPYFFFYFLLTQIKHLYKKPFIIGSIIQIIGYFMARWILIYKPFPKYVAKQLQKEQKQRFKFYVRNLWNN